MPCGSSKINKDILMHEGSSIHDKPEEGGKVQWAQSRVILKSLVFGKKHRRWLVDDDGDDNEVHKFKHTTTDASVILSKIDVV